jgi:hypothetical protein
MDFKSSKLTVNQIDMAKKDIFKTDNYLIGFGVFLLIIGLISIFTDPRTYSELVIIDGTSVTFEDWNNRTIEDIQREKGEQVEIIVPGFPLKRAIMAGSGLFLFIIGRIFRAKENKIIAVWDALERVPQAKVRDLEVSLSIPRDFILKNLKHINAQQGAYYIYSTDNDSIIDGRLTEEHVVTMNCSGCGNSTSEKISLAFNKPPACKYCGNPISVDEVSRIRRETLAAKPVVEPESTFSIPIFVVLLIFFWPAAIIYLIVKKSKSVKNISEKMVTLQNQMANSQTNQ